MKRAFTLIELLVVVLIIGILAAVAVPQYQVAVAKSRFSTLKTNMQNLAQSVELYHLANGKYPAALNEVDFSIAGCDYKGALVCSQTHSSYTYVVNEDGSDPRIHGLIYPGTQGKGVQYSIYLTRNYRLCSALPAENNIAIRVCKSETSAEGSASGENMTFKYP